MTADGRIKGSAVYMLLCQDDSGPIYVKFGRTSNPQSRLDALRTGTPITPRRFAYASVESRQAAVRLEQDLLDTFENHRTNGEWFRFDRSEKPLFNSLWQSVFARHATCNWPLHWNQLGLQRYAEWKRKRSNVYRSQAMKSGRSFRDAAADMRR